MPRFTKYKPYYLDLCIFIALIICGAALYFLPLQNASFYYDDRASIVNNEVIKKIDIPKIFNAFNTRSLVGLSFALNYKWCQLNPFGYRLTNLLIHCLNAFLVYLLIKSTLNPANRWAATFGAILFLCHPIQTETVNSITQRFVLMASFFYLLTIILYIQYRCRSQKRYMILSLISAIAAMFCKEFTVTLPLMLCLYDFYFLNCHSEPQGRRISNWMRSFASLRMTIPFFAIALIVPVLLLRTPREAIGPANIADPSSNHGHIDITRAKGSISREGYFLTELNVVRTYVRLMFLPINQNFDYDYPLSYKPDITTLLSGAFLLCLLVLAAVTRRTYRIISFSILWFFISLSVESSFVPIANVIEEYRLYLASVGFVFLAVDLLYIRKADVRKLNMIAAAVLIGFSVLTYQRNKIWKDEFSLWDDTIKKSPHKARAYNNRGLEYYGQGRLTEAISDFSKAIEINPNSAAAYNNRGVLYEIKGNKTQAISDFNKAIELNPGYAGARRNLDGLRHAINN